MATTKDSSTFACAEHVWGNFKKGSNYRKNNKIILINKA